MPWKKVHIYYKHLQRLSEASLFSWVKESKLASDRRLKCFVVFKFYAFFFFRNINGGGVFPCSFLMPFLPHLLDNAASISENKYTYNWRTVHETTGLSFLSVSIFEFCIFVEVGSRLWNTQFYKRPIHCDLVGRTKNGLVSFGLTSR